MNTIIYWKDIPSDSKIILKDEGYFYKNKAIYWLIREEIEAVKFLNGLIK